MPLFAREVVVQSLEKKGRNLPGRAVARLSVDLRDGSRGRDPLQEAMDEAVETLLKEVGEKVPPPVEHE